MCWILINCDQHKYDTYYELWTRFGLGCFVFTKVVVDLTHPYQFAGTIAIRNIQDSVHVYVGGWRTYGARPEGFL